MSEESPGLTPIERERMILRQQIEADSHTIRIGGFVAMGLGLVILAIIAAVAFYTVPAMLAEGESVDGTRFTGGPEARLMVFAVYALVAAIGLTAMLSGAVHVATGRRFRLGIRMMFLLVSLIFAAAAVIRAIG